MQNIPQVNNVPYCNNAEFVKLTIYNDINNLTNGTVYTFSSSYKYETIDSVVYTPLGGFLMCGTQQRDLRVTQADTSVQLSGIDGNNIYVVFGNKIRGSRLEIYRGFYDDNYNLTNVALRFTGIITSYQVTEELDISANKDNFVVTVNASSYKTVLENRIAGRKTNKDSWRLFDPLDASMDQIAALSDQQFDFGKEPIRQPSTQSTAQSDINRFSGSNDSQQMNDRA